MNALMKSELTKLRTVRSTVILLAAGTLIHALWALGTALTAGHEDLPPLGTPSNIANLLRGGGVSTWVLLIVGVMTMAGEYQHHTVTSTFLTTPVRRSVLGAKVATIGCVGVAYATTNMIIGLVVAIPVAVSRHSHLQLTDTHVVGVAVGLVGATILYGTFGVALGALLRNQTLAVTAVVLWFSMIENLVGIVVRQHNARWLPGFAAQAAAGVGSHTLLVPVAGAAVFAGYVALAAIAASRMTLQRDMT